MAAERGHLQPVAGALSTEATVETAPDGSFSHSSLQVETTVRAVYMATRELGGQSRDVKVSWPGGRPRSRGGLLAAGGVTHYPPDDPGELGGTVVPAHPARP